MKIDFTNKTVVVTGGTRGVGAAIVQLFQECNAEIIATGTNLDNLKRLNEKSSDKRTKYTHLDFISDDSVQNFLETICIVTN